LGKSNKLRYRRILLKVSGEAIEGDGSAFDLQRVGRIAEEIGGMQREGVEIGLVVGGGNIVRGGYLEKEGLSRNQSDYMGMLATLINGLLFESILNKNGTRAVLQSALAVRTVAEEVVLRNTLRYLEEGSVTIFAGGTGSPYFTTDTAAALRACEIGAQVLMKATKVDGVFDKDPERFEDALFFERLSYSDVLARQLKVIDMAAVSMCLERRIPIVVFNIYKEGSMKRLVHGERIGTIIEG